MNRNSLWLGVAAILLIAGVAYVLLAKPSTAPAPAATLPQLSADLYPLFSGAQWGSPQAVSITFGTTTYPGVTITSATTTDTLDPASVFTPFENYYDQKLKTLGWQEANEFAAGGHTGGESGYRKGGQIILTSFNINYKNVPADAPSECPCDVTLSLFSSGVQ